MPSKADLERLFRSGAQAQQAPAARPAAPAQAAPTLPPPPAGYAYIPDAVHGFILVQIAAPPAAPARPAHVAPATMPPGVLPSNVVPFRRSAQLIRTGTFQGHAVDPYQEFLDRLPNIDPEQSPGLWAGLVPDPRDPTIAAMIERPTALHEHSEAREDPVADAWGTRPPATNVLPLANVPGGAGGGGGAPDPAA